jgi:hypothetical protein
MNPTTGIYQLLKEEGSEALSDYIWAGLKPLLDLVVYVHC